jgi:hypothetical protein
MSNELDISRIVNLNISVSPMGLQTAGFGVLNIIGTSDVIPLDERIRAYNTFDDVASDFDSNDEEYKAASIFFSQIPKPSDLRISRRLAAGTAGELISGDVTAADVISEGYVGFDISVGGTEYNIMTAITTEADLQDLVDTINAEFTSESCPATAAIYDTTKIKITTTGTGATTGAITYATNPASNGTATELELTEATATSLTQGLDAETIADSLDAMNEVDPTWFGFSFTKEVRDASVTTNGTGKDVINAAAWAEANSRWFCNNSSDPLCVSPTSTTDIAYELKEFGYSYTSTDYNPRSDYQAVSVFARGATVDFNGTNTTITYALKVLPGILPVPLSPSNANALMAKNCNFYANYGTKLSGDAVPVYMNGQMANGRFMDEVVGLSWLDNDAKTTVFNFLYQQTTKLPQTDEGVSRLAAKLAESLQRAVDNGLAAAGMVDTAEGSVFLPKGYEIFTKPVAEQSQSQREARQAPSISFILKGAGAIHGVTISGTFQR